MLTLLVLCAAASAQTLRPADDPRNIAPTVGTGGTPGGPTGLFTVYDGQTLRKGEFTFSFAYSNFDRDPGNVDITEVPVSFQIGLSDHLELFFNTDAYRGVKVNNPQQLSSFYLPNSQLFLRAQDAPTGNFGPLILQSGPAIIQAPIRVSGSQLVVGTANAIFRPTGNQPFVQFPFVGGRGPNFGLAGNPGTGTGASVPFVSTLGAANGGGGNWGAASNFPGIGSPVGSILPGIVLTQRRTPANLTFQELILPDLFTIAPAYLPDAPFINRLYGESSFSTHTFGAKIRFTDPENPLGVGIIPMYRWYWDSADDEQGFNQLQRGSSPGGGIGDFGLVGFVDGRLSKRVNLSGNIGYFLNSNPKSEAFGIDNAILLDRPDELVWGVGVDFPLNSSFQPILELKGTRYVGGRTPNAFPNNPMDFLGGVRVFPARWLGFSAWYRAHLNQQGDRLFNDWEGPAGFTPSEDPHGFGFQFFIGHRHDRRRDRVTVQATLGKLDKVTLPYVGPTPHLPCPAKTPEGPACQTNSAQVTVTADVRYFVAPENDPSKAEDLDESCLTYIWTVLKAGSEEVAENVKISPNPTNQQEATIDLAGADPGSYTVKLLVEERDVEASERISCFALTDIAVDRCPPPPTPYPLPTPSPVIDCPERLTFRPGQELVFTASVANEAEIKRLGPDAILTYEWSVDRGKITAGQGTLRITVDTTGINQPITATLRVGYAGRPDCPYGETSCRAVPSEQCTVFDQFVDIPFNDEKARLDLFAIRLNIPEPIIGYYQAWSGPGAPGAERRIIGAERAERGRGYMTVTTGDRPARVSNADRIIASAAPDSPQCFTAILWVCPAGVTPPTDPNHPHVAQAMSEAQAEVGSCGVKAPPRAGGGRRQPVRRARRERVRRSGRTGS